MIWDVIPRIWYKITRFTLGYKKWDAITQQPFKSRGKRGILIWQFNQICRGMLFCYGGWCVRWKIWSWNLILIHEFDGGWTFQIKKSGWKCKHICPIWTRYFPMIFIFKMFMLESKLCQEIMNEIFLSLDIDLATNI